MIFIRLTHSPQGEQLKYFCCLVFIVVLFSLFSMFCKIVEQQ